MMQLTKNGLYQSPIPRSLSCIHGVAILDYHDQRRIIDISVEHVSPIFAKEFLDSIIREGDKVLREFDMQVSIDSLEYLNT